MYCYCLPNCECYDYNNFIDHQSVTFKRNRAFFLVLPSSRHHSPLQMSDLCAPPLKPLILQPEDEANLAEWFKTLWASVAPSKTILKNNLLLHNQVVSHASLTPFLVDAVEVSPNQFDWFFYKDKVLGLLLDVHSGPVWIGRLLLGSYTKKPLWVDHSATTVRKLETHNCLRCSTLS